VTRKLGGGFAAAAAAAREMAAGGRVSIPVGARRTVADIKEIAGGHTDEEVYAMLRECNMDPNETAQRLLLQGSLAPPPIPSPIPSRFRRLIWFPGPCGWFELGVGRARLRLRHAIRFVLGLICSVLGRGYGRGLRWRHYWGCIFRVFGIQQAASAALGKRLRSIVLLISIEVGGLLVTFFSFGDDICQTILHL